jgi:uncharacterized protein YdaU (DUF1376 family)
MTKPNRWMPLDWGDYWRDTAHLNAAEHGAYLNLLGAYWVNGAPLPDDDVRLARLARTSRAEWRSVRNTVRAFFRGENGALHHGRVDREIARAVEVHASRAKRMGQLNAKQAIVFPAMSFPPSSPQSQSQSQSPSPSPSQDSGPIGPAADAASGGGDDPQTPAQPTALKARIFGPCLAWLAAQSHISQARARALTVRWCAKFGDGAVLEAFTAAARQSPLDPVPYIEKVLHNGPIRIAGSNDPTNIHARRQRDAARAAGDHLAGLRAALGAGSVGALRESAADPQPLQLVEADRRV